ncbi:MAG: hypothetical protein HY870_11330 [Chloroflexi bacterium]|nr:hypothetical protein [Chloroflexota bacterium]
MDNLIRRSMHEAVDNLEPSAGVREALLAQAASTVGQSSALGPAVPALADGLHENAAAESPRVAVPQAITVGNGQWLLLTTAPLYAVR